MAVSVATFLLGLALGRYVGPCAVAVEPLPELPRQDADASDRETPPIPDAVRTQLAVLHARLEDCESELETLRTGDDDGDAMPPWPEGLDSRFLPAAVEVDLEALLAETDGLESIAVDCRSYPCMVALFEAHHDGLDPKATTRDVRDFLPGTHAARSDVGTGYLYTFVVSDLDTAMAGTPLAASTSTRLDAFSRDMLRTVVAEGL